ncbi:MAG: DUF1643 domain-containing protein [Clostridia bacterium]|nr:DUF1643 domain-containing protein [Clostridia bacterium]
MHIPAKTLTESEITPFALALSEQETADVSYDRNAWLYVPHTYLEYRYILGTRGENPLICIGINPSTAAPGDLDNTLKSVSRIAHGNGYDSFIMFNVYAQRATDPDAMDLCRNEALHRENMAAFDHILSLYRDGRTPAVWAAWGTVIERRSYLIPTVRDMIAIGERHGAKWYSVGARSKKGHPHHPLYLRSDAAAQPFDVSAYLDTLEQYTPPRKRSAART